MTNHQRDPIEAWISTDVALMPPPAAAAAVRGRG